MSRFASSARVLASAVLVLILASCRHAKRGPMSTDESRTEIVRLADEYVAEFIARFPDWAELSAIPLPRHDGFRDNSLAAEVAWEKLEDAWAERLSAIDPRPLFGQPEWVTLGFLRETIEASRQQRVCRRELWQGVSHMTGWQVEVAALAQAQPVGTNPARDEALARYSKLPLFLDNEIANLREGVKLGFTSPRRNVDLVVKQLDATLALPVEKWPMCSPATRDGTDEFRAQFSELLSKRIVPAVQKYRDFLRDDYRPKARENQAVSALPEVARSAVDRARTAAPRFFERLPRADVRVEPYPDELGPEVSDSYWPPTGAQKDGTYRIGLLRFADRTRSDEEDTAFHETYPGHHLQIGLALELPNAHPISRIAATGGFVEGWARYAEALAEELGLYSTDYARIQRRLWPARGMVLDPGFHVQGWSRARVVDFVLESGRFSEKEAEDLVDRIAVMPGQLTSYDSGGLEFFELRRDGERELGSRFDLRSFHAVVLGHGAVTLPMLRELVRDWIERQKTRG